MPIIIYRRHSHDCPVHKTNLNAAEKRHFMDCQCPLWLCGRTDTAIVPRQSCKTADLAIAQAKRSKLLAYSADVVTRGPRLSDCIRKYIESRDDIGSEAEKHYRLFLGRLEAFATGRGVVFIQGLTVDLLEDFKTEAEGLKTLGGNTRSVAVAKVRCFLRDAYRRGWITEPLVEKLRPVRARYEAPEPYNEGEVSAILETAEGLNYGKGGYASQPGAFRLLLELMLETGMRCGDAVRFDPARLIRGESGLWIYTFPPQKQRRDRSPKVLEAYLRGDLKQRIDESWRETGWPLPFKYTTSVEPKQVNQRMVTVGRRCGIADCRPHRLRDTFAVRLLLRGVPLEDVSRLLGHSSIKVTESHYAKWTSSRKRRLETIVAQSLLDSGNGALRNG